MFTDRELEYLTGQPLGRLATSAPDGTLQVNPVGYRVDRDRGTIDIGGWGMSRSRKYRNVADNGRAAFVVDDVASTDPWRVRFLEVRGHAETIEDPGGDPSAAVIRLRPERILALGLEPGDLERSPHELTVRSRDVG
ncbi:PPOX class F420-dependent oxidoreductase [Pseudonocardia nematodicida]|uniref:PPOX class F420-dependent oxidoreductase n=1 Tax=Pseudonocardia nematodicida TaxID=1206997 RepID=A0ABV1K8M2_9PSEU